MSFFRSNRVYHLAGLFLLNGLLISPLVAFFVVVHPQGGVDHVFWLNCVFSGLWLLALNTNFRRPFVLHLVIIPLYVITIVDLFLISQFYSRLSSSYASLAITDYGELSEFLSSYGSSVLIVSVVFGVVFAFGLTKVRQIQLRFPPLVRAGTLALLLSAYGAVIGRQMIAGGMTLSGAALDVALHDFSCPVGGVFQVGIAAGLHFETKSQVAERSTFKFDATKIHSEPDEVYVAVVGESSRPDHWSFMNYHRDTTPRLRQLKNVIFLDNMISTASLTSLAVPSMFSLASVADWNSVLRQSSIVSAFNEVGFQTHWLSAQEVSHWSGTIHLLAQEASSVRYFTRSYDIVLLDEMRRIIDGMPRPRKLMIVLHTKGSHFDFARRYPPEFKKFPDEGGSQIENVTNAYDNSIVYTDYILSEIIQTIDSLDCYSLVFFASDHGENLFDDDRQIFGHGLNNKYDLYTSAVVWYSDEVAAKFPEKIAMANKLKSKPLSLESFSHSLLDVAGIQARGFDLTKSVFSESFVERPRLVFLNGEANHYAGGPLKEEIE